MDEELVDVEEMARKLKVHKSWIYARTRETGPDAIPRLKLKKYLRFKPAAVMEWLEQQNREQ